MASIAEGAAHLLRGFIQRSSQQRSHSFVRRQSTTTYNVDRVFKDLNNIIVEAYKNSDNDHNGPPTISKSASVLENAARDASCYPLQVSDICVTPTTVEQVKNSVKYCYDNNVPIVPVGARTGLEGGIHALAGGVSFDMSRMLRMLSLNADDQDCHVEAGLNWRELNNQLRSHGLWFPVDPGASASLGGMASTSASGTNAVKYGTMRENVIGLEVVVRDGQIIKTAGKSSRTKKTSAGINLTNLFVGSEGTLGLITSVRLKLQALPACLAVATVAFPNVELAVDSVVKIMQCGLPIARIEFLDQPGVEACFRASKLANLDPERPMLFIELQGINEQNIEDQIDIMRDIFDSNQASKLSWSAKQEERSELWKARHNLHWSIVQTKPGYSNIDTDVCVPLSHFPEMVMRTHELIARYGLYAPLMGHAGDGNFHSVILFDPKETGAFEKAKELASEMARVAIKLEGTVTGEHGVGRGKISLIEEQFDSETMDVMYDIKRALDPKNLFNPGKIFKFNERT